MNGQFVGSTPKLDLVTVRLGWTGGVPRVDLNDWLSC